MPSSNLFAKCCSRMHAIDLFSAHAFLTGICTVKDRGFKAVVLLMNSYTCIKPCGFSHGHIYPQKTRAMHRTDSKKLTSYPLPNVDLFSYFHKFTGPTSSTS